MSDTNIAPAAPASAPSSSPAPSNEVPIDQNPTSSPQPIGSQAPEKPPEERHVSRRESIQKAFDRARDPDAAPPKKRGMGDNNPPEPMAKEKAEPDKAARPAQHREGGRFARSPDPGQQTAPGATPGRGADRQGAQQGAQQPARQYTPLPETAPYREPPPRFSEGGKQEWSAVPEGVRGDVYRMAREYEGAYQRYRGDHEEMNNIRNFHEMATQHGTTLARALNNYVSMEQKLRTDLVGGLDVIVNNLNLRTQEGQKIGIRDVAYHILNQNPEQHRLIQQGNAQQAQMHQIGALHQEMAGLKTAINQMHTERVFGQTRSAVDQFADSHPRFDELGGVIEQEVKLGFDLETAYQRADRLYPSNAAAQTRTAPAQTRQDKSIYGAPESSPSDGQRRKNDKPVGRREAIQNAINRVNGSA